MVRTSIKTFILDNYLLDREALLGLKEKSLFDFLFLTGTRISEALMVKGSDIDWGNNRVNIHTLKNPSDPYRSVRFFPDNDPVLVDSVKAWAKTSESLGSNMVWEFSHRKIPQTYVWERCKETFNCTTHSFRHTNATLFCRAVRPNLNELMGRYGWKDPKPALIYIKYGFDESLDEKINEFYEKGGKL